MLSDEERKAISHLTEKMKYHKDNPLGTYVWLTLDEHYVRTILNLIEKQQKEIEELDLTTVYISGVYDGEKKVEDKIKAKIEPVLKQLERKMQEEYNKYGNSREYQDIVDAYNFLHSLLEKE